MHYITTTLNKLQDLFTRGLNGKTSSVSNISDGDVCPKGKSIELVVTNSMRIPCGPNPSVPGR